MLEKRAAKPIICAWSVTLDGKSCLSNERMKERKKHPNILIDLKYRTSKVRQIIQFERETCQNAL